MPFDFRCRFISLSTDHGTDAYDTTRSCRRHPYSRTFISIILFTAGLFTFLRAFLIFSSGESASFDLPALFCCNHQMRLACAMFTVSWLHLQPWQFPPYYLCFAWRIFIILEITKKNVAFCHGFAGCTKLCHDFHNNKSGLWFLLPRFERIMHFFFRLTCVISNNSWVIGFMAFSITIHHSNV